VTPLGRQEEWENSPERLSPDPDVQVGGNWHDNYVADAAPDKKWGRGVRCRRGGVPGTGEN